MERLENMVGQVLDGRYQLRAVTGVGGSAVVFRAEDLLLSRRVAIKMLRSEAAPGAYTGSETMEQVEARASEARRINRSAFRREAIAASVLSHPNIVGIYDVSPDTDNPYIVMEFVEGVLLSDRLRELGALSVREVLYVAHCVLLALEEAHAHGIIHRDIKAQNILLTPDGEVKVTDFGIAQIPGNTSVRLNGRVLGTVDTISPEQASGKRVDERSDLYSLGVLLYEMATGSLPFEGDKPETVAFLHIHEPPRYPSTLNPGVSRGLEQIILTALEKQPDKRFASAAAMLAAVKKLEENPAHVFRRFRTRRRIFVRETGGVRFGRVMVCGAIAAMLCLVLFLASADLHPLPQVKVVELPSYVGLLYADVGSALPDGRVAVEVTYIYRPDMPAGVVLSQYPAAGERLKLDGPDDCPVLHLTVSTADETIKGTEENHE